MRELCRKIRGGLLRNEAEVRSEFMRVVRTFTESPEFEGVDIREEERIVRGRPDARIGGLSIEFESPFLRKGELREKVTDNKIEQARGYIMEHRQKGQVVRAIVTNGVEMVFIDEEGNLVERGLLCQGRP